MLAAAFLLLRSVSSADDFFMGFSIMEGSSRRRVERYEQSHLQIKLRLKNHLSESNRRMESNASGEDG